MESHSSAAALKPEPKAIRHMLNFAKFSRGELTEMILRGIDIKNDPAFYGDYLARRGLLLLFEKTSTRTSLSFQSAISQLGGYAVVLDWMKSNFAISPIHHEVSYASRNCDIIVARLKRHQDLQSLAANSRVPVINGCDEKYHPTQALADLMTVREVAGAFDGVSIAFVGVLNNVANSLIELCMKLDVHLILVTPIVSETAKVDELLDAAQRNGNVEWMDSVAQAARRVDFIYTDTWVDMEHFNDPSYKDERDRRTKKMQPFQLNEQNLGGALPYVMHDMPIHPGFEIEEALVHSPKSVIYQQAENRMHVEKAILLSLLGRL